MHTDDDNTCSRWKIGIATSRTCFGLKSEFLRELRKCDIKSGEHTWDL